MVIATSSIIGVTFGLNGTEQIIAKAPFEIKSAEIIKDETPVAGGLYDTTLGSTEKYIRCGTCMKSGGNCLGHNGHIKISKPVFQTMAIPQVIKWLRIICHKCSKPHSCTGSFESCLDKLKRQVSKSKNKEAITCMHCNAIQRRYTINTAFRLIYNASEVDSAGRDTENITLRPDDIQKIFDAIPDETLKSLDIPNVAHPRNYFVNAQQVTANTTRPQTVQAVNGVKSNTDEITKMYKYIYTVNQKLEKTDKVESQGRGKKTNTIENDDYMELNANIVQLIQGPVTGEDAPVMSDSESKPLPSLFSKTKSKEGLLRKNIQGKRSWNLGRSTITGDPRLYIPSITIPRAFSQKISKRITYRSYNEKRIFMLIANAKIKQYPMAVNIIKNGIAYPVSRLESGQLTLNYGDQIDHNLMDGDYVNFNRQPTLELCSISSHFLRVNNDPKELTIAMNVIACDFYNADFDGDEMNTQHARYLHTTVELRAISAFHNFVISNTNGSPQIGQINDSIVGLYELTKNDVRLNRTEAMSLFRNTTFLPKFDKEEYTGRDIITLCLQKTPVNYTGKPTSYDPSLEPYMNYHESEKKVIIRNGIMISGVLDKASIGSGGHKNLYHIVESDYGAEAMINVMFDMQQISIDYIALKGFSLGTRDILLPEDARAKIVTEESNLINESKVITDRLNRGAIIPPIGKNSREFYEELQINALRPGDIYNEIILRNINRKNNGLLSIILAGSKGKINNLMAISARAGQMLINGERLRENAGYRRTTVYNTRFDDDPRAYGYITNSYTSGQTVLEYFSNASNARFDLITKALSTSITGDKNRNAVKNLENIIVDNLFRCMRGRKVVQLIEGEDGLNPQKVETVKFDFMTLSNEELRKRYADVLEPEYLTNLLQAKETLSENLLKISRMKISTPVESECRSPFDIKRIILNHFGDIEKKGTPVRNWEVIKEFVDSLPRVYLNTKYRGPVPKQMIYSVTNMQCYTIGVLIDYAPWMTKEQLIAIFNDCKSRFYNALIDPGTAIGIQTGQSICAPMTQYMLDSHTRSASGGTAKDSMNHVQEIVGATPPEKLSNPTMYLVPSADIIQDRSAVQIVANEIEMMDFNRFVDIPECFFEEYGNPVHPKYKHEKDEIAEFDKVTLQKRPTDLINWCIRYPLKKSEMILKGMSVSTITKSLREQNPECYFMYKSDISKNVYIRQYFRQSKKTMDEELIKKISNDMLKQVVRGIPGIKSAQVTQHQYTNPVTFKTENGFAIKTLGSNIAGIVTKKGIDPTQVHSSSIIEIERFYGVIAARNKIIVELDVIASGGDPRHKFLYADEMTRIGRVVNIERPGLAVREPTDILGRAALSSPAKAYTDAALNRVSQEICGISDRLLMGDIPKIGTTYNTKYLNVDFVKNNVRGVSDFMSELD